MTTAATKVGVGVRVIGPRRWLCTRCGLRFGEQVTGIGAARDPLRKVRVAACPKCDAAEHDEPVSDAPPEVPQRITDGDFVVYARGTLKESGLRASEKLALLALELCIRDTGKATIEGIADAMGIHPIGAKKLIDVMVKRKLLRWVP